MLTPTNHLQRVSGHPGALFQHERQPIEAASRELPGGWLIRGNVDTQGCADARGDRSQICVADDRRRSVKCRGGTVKHAPDSTTITR
jgi:hypothetical protein